jgi:hypothetical protein
VFFLGARLCLQDLVQQLEILVEQSRGGEIAKPSSRCQRPFKRNSSLTVVYWVRDYVHEDPAAKKAHKNRSTRVQEGNGYGMLENERAKDG